MGFPGGSVLKNLPAKAGDKRNMGSIFESRRSPGEGNGNPFKYSCLENSVDRGDWWATVHGVTKRWTQPNGLSMHAHTYVDAGLLIYALPPFPFGKHKLFRFVLFFSISVSLFLFCA